MFTSRIKQKTRTTTTITVLKRNEIISPVFSWSSCDGDDVLVMMVMMSIMMM